MHKVYYVNMKNETIFTAKTRETEWKARIFVSAYDLKNTFI